jgi:hypothetical protein
LSTKLEKQIQWRRSKVAELDSQGHSQPEMASILQVSIGTVNRDLSYLRQQAKSNIRRYWIDERLPEEWEIFYLRASTKIIINSRCHARIRLIKSQKQLAYKNSNFLTYENPTYRIRMCNKHNINTINNDSADKNSSFELNALTKSSCLHSHNMMLNTSLFSSLRASS